MLCFLAIISFCSQLCMNSEQETESKETNSRRASFYLLWVPYWQSPVKGGQTASCGLWVVCFVTGNPSFHSSKEVNQFDMILSSCRKGTTSLFSRLCRVFFLFNCKTYSTIEAIIICTCQSILTYYTVVMAFYLRREGLKALHEMKGT